MQLNLIVFQETIWTSGGPETRQMFAPMIVEDHTCVDIHYILFILTTETE